MNVKKRILLLLSIPVLVVLSFFSGISFSIPVLNTVAFLGALVSFIVLSKYCGSIKLKWYFDLMLAGGWIFSILLGIFLLLDLIDHANPNLQNVEQNQFCTQSCYGFVGTNGGIQMRAYKRFWIFDKEIGSHRSSDMYQSPNDSMDIYAFCKDKKIVKLK